MRQLIILWWLRFHVRTYIWIDQNSISFFSCFSVVSLKFHIRHKKSYLSLQCLTMTMLWKLIDFLTHQNQNRIWKKAILTTEYPAHDQTNISNDLFSELFVSFSPDYLMAVVYVYSRIYFIGCQNKSTFIWQYFERFKFQSKNRLKQNSNKFNEFSDPTRPKRSLVCFVHMYAPALVRTYRQTTPSKLMTTYDR